MAPSHLKTWLASWVALSGVLLFLARIPAAVGQPPAGEFRDRSGESVASDKNQLQGKWQIQSIMLDGKTHRREDKSPLWKAAFHSDLLVQGERLTHGQAHKGNFTLDETKSPKQITVHDAEGKLTFRGIYILEGQNLKVCMCGNSKDARRPEDFTAKHGTAQAVISFKRSARP